MSAKRQRTPFLEMHGQATAGCPAEVCAVSSRPWPGLEPGRQQGEHTCMLHSVSLQGPTPWLPPQNPKILKFYPVLHLTSRLT